MKTRIVILALFFSLLLSSCDEIATPPQPAPTQSASPTLEVFTTPSSTFIIEDTPPSEATLAAADRVLAFGDFNQALELFSANTTGSSNDIQAAALYGQGLTYYKQNDLFQAKRAFTELQSQFPGSLPAKRANFLLAQISLGQELEEDALEFYQAYALAQP